MDEWFRKLREQQEMLRRIAEGPLRHVRENQAALARMGELAAGLDVAQYRRMVDAFGPAARLSELAAASEFAHAAFAALAVPSTVQAMQRYADEHRGLLESVNHFSWPVKTITEQVAAMSRLIDASRWATSGIDMDRIGELVGVAGRESESIARVTSRLMLRQAELIASLNVPTGQLASVPSFVSELPAIDVFVHTQAVRTITPHAALTADQEHTTASLSLQVELETAEFLELVLAELHPSFLNQYRGAKACAAERGPDWWTQGSASLRKLLKGVLHRAAPNELVLPWAVQNKKALDRVGRPTRDTKLEWLCSFISNDAYRAFVRTELRSALALLELLDRAQHVDEFPEFEAQYNWTLMRAEVAVRHILSIWRARQ